MGKLMMSLCLVSAVLFVCPSTASAQGTSLMFSTSGDAQLPGRTADDGEVCRFVAGGTPVVHFNGAGLTALLGELPTDIDGLHFEGTGRPSYRSFQFSLLSDQLGFQDGDILTLDAAGQIVLVLDEASIAAALGIPGSAIDVDGFTYNAQGELLVTIDGNVGSIQDGDVYRIPAGGQAVLMYSEDQIRALVENALGTTLSSIGDTLGLAWDPASNKLAFTVQSPSSDDATVFVDDQGGRVIAGYTEADFGFGNAVELNAIAFTTAPVDGMPTLDVDDATPAEGATIQLSLSSGTPNGLYWLMASGQPLYQPYGPGLGGTEVWLLDPNDPTYQQLAGNWWRFIGRWDAQGQAVISTTVPFFGGQKVTSWVQTVDLSAGAISNPITIDVN
ncbi:MAG: hypothetical protein RL885_15625 [Planctomycetota bacterium]